MKLTQVKIYRFIKKVAITLTIIFAVLLLDKFLSLLTETLFNFSLHQYGWPLILMKIYRTLVAGSLIGCLVCWIIVLLLYLYRLLHKDAESEIRDNIASPLLHVTEQQEKELINLLKRAGGPIDGSDKMNRAEVAKVLYILNMRKYLDTSGNPHRVRLWVEKVTELRDSDPGHFNEQYKKRAKLDDNYEKIIKEILQIND